MSKEIDRKTVMLLSAESGLDPRTVERATRNGIKSLRAAVDRERLQKAAKKLSISLS